MAISFSDLHTEVGLKSLEQYLSGKTYISGDQLTRDDIKVYAAVSEKPGNGFPNASRWYECVSSQLAARFAGKPAGVKIAGQAAKSEPTPVEAKKDALEGDDDDLDLFGDETEEEKKASEEREAAAKASAKKKERYKFAGKPAGVKIAGQAAKSEPTPVEAKKDALEGDDDDLDLFGDETEEEKKASEEREAAAKASAKKKESGKSSVLMDVKPWDDETDMKKLEEAVRSIEMPGLLWGASKLVPVGYGIKKLQIMLTIVDDLVSVDNLIEDYLTAEPANEYIQSCDIVAFNKI